MNKTVIKKKCQDILNKYNNGEILTIPDFEYMLDILKLHPLAKEKIGVGILSMRVEVSPWKKNKGFILIRKDGSRMDFSFYKCISGADADYVKFYKACRLVVAQDIVLFKKNVFKTTPTLTCPITSAKINFDNSHIDHAYLFEDIIKDFINQHSIDIKKVVYVQDKDEQYGSSFADEELIKKFQEFHTKKAQLRAVSIRANLSILKKRERK